ncbi:MAG: ABC transporter ATP-binding protein [Anaerolineae bacterium]
MLLEVKDLHVYYGAIHALQGVTFRVDEGQIVTLIGANGAGKSTTLNTISGLLVPRQGSMMFHDKDLTRVQAQDIVRLGIIQVPEGRKIFAPLTVLENLEMGAYTRSNKVEIQDSLDRVFQRLPRLKERVKQLGGTLSGGEQQMLAIGRALMARPQLLLLDEPSMGLSPVLVEEVFSIIEDINAQGTAILLVEQNAQMALSVADRAYVLETGRVTLEGTGQELLHNPQVMEAYLGGH